MQNCKMEKVVNIIIGLGLRFTQFSQKYTQRLYQAVDEQRTVEPSRTFKPFTYSHKFIDPKIVSTAWQNFRLAILLSIESLFYWVLQQLRKRSIVH